jgi:hypothetical protein
VNHAVATPEPGALVTAAPSRDDELVQTPGWLVALPQPLRGAVVGAAGLGAAGGVVGLLVGLLVFPPTAWAAAIEMGLPAAFVGATIGVLAGWLSGTAARRHP